jgi:Transposase DDE domain
VIQQLSRNRSEQIAYYRYLENEQVTITELVRSLADHCQQQVAQKHVLAISDTSEINLETHRGRLKPEGVGVVGNNRDLGFFIHPTLILDAEDGFPLGLSHVQLWTRAIAHANKEERNYSKLPIEAKESYKWLASAEQSQRCLQVGDAQKVTHIGDREADLYEEWATVPDRYNHVLVRVHQDRRLFEQSKFLYDYLSAQPGSGSYSIQVEGDARQKRTTREALVNVRFAPVKIQRPDKLKEKDYPESIELYAVEVKEDNPPTGQKPVHWRLMTTHEIRSLEQAIQVIKWYCWRWRIEQLFATLKQKGLNVEASQMESVSAIERLTILALSVALRTLQMVEGRDNLAIPASVVFSQVQQECLRQIAPSLKGKTQKQQNPYPPATLAWSVWLIARMGGWSGYETQRPPGMITLVRGLRQFESTFMGWKMALGGLVCTR